MFDWSKEIKSNIRIWFGLCCDLYLIYEFLIFKKKTCNTKTDLGQWVAIGEYASSYRERSLTLININSS